MHIHCSEKHNYEFNFYGITLTHIHSTGRSQAQRWLLTGCTEHQHRWLKVAKRGWSTARNLEKKKLMEMMNLLGPFRDYLNNKSRQSRHQRCVPLLSVHAGVEMRITS